VYTVEDMMEEDQLTDDGSPAFAHLADDVHRLGERFRRSFLTMSDTTPGPPRGGRLSSSTASATVASPRIVATGRSLVG